MQFHYKASETSGKLIEGDLDAGSPGEVLEWMVQRSLKPISIKVAGVGAEKIMKGRFSAKITIEDQVFLTKYLALMLKVGTDLFKAIDILVLDFNKPAMKALLLEMKDALGKGQPFYTTFARHPQHFSPVFVNLIKAGESSGTLEEVLNKLSVDLEKQWELRNKIKGSLVYPFILVILSLVVLFLMVSLALPQIAETFTSGALEPPLFSRIVFAIGFFFRDYMVLLIFSFISMGVGTWIFLKSVTGKRFVSRLIGKTPVVKEVIRKIALQRFASTLSSLIRSGTPILEALETTAESAGIGELKDALIRIAREGLTKGLTVGEAFRKEPYFPRVVVNLVAISEQSGHLEEVLDTLSDFYESEIDASIKTLVSFLEPALLVVIGGVVGLVAVAVIVPIYQLVGQV
ncbi:MAG: hypothetical protein A3G58_01080 [Candidatus Colwellbacteria bacterium RIFCSPLOWO2_12_FULL_46_17]|uniref:Type II secretion system protein GspF domain-containing protein n=1 Tax=Candidatus Colwellbacteria bacterium RIFCSPLOWO2_12_FULL_46_17 TaxID=1797695 RepID=A0A1G1ZCR5_9BACT|nr:MAG: hypothetical protein A3G58_01080 [Candidatus Colwellbacteria bacterium RIFCSPLOWO2_12_FULL_46_17]